MARVQAKKKGPVILLGRPLAELVNEDLQHPEFRRAYLGEAMDCMASGDIQTGKAILRDYINGTLGFIALGKALGKSPKSLMRMLSSTGNPQISNFFEIVVHLQKIDKMILTVQGIAA